MSGRCEHTFVADKDGEVTCSKCGDKAVRRRTTSAAITAEEPPRLQAAREKRSWRRHRAGVRGA